MSKFLIFIPLPKEQAALGEQLVRSAVCFLETQGKVDRVNLGEFERSGRKDSSAEVLKLVELKLTGGAGDVPRARALEGVLRSTLTAAGVHAGEVRVFAGSA